MLPPDMLEMFSSWNTAKVTDMGSMFAGCISLRTLDISNWAMDQVVKAEDMFFEAGITREEALGK